ncbi:sensor histidine kinase [Cyclobacterium jeungdonense]|uniref:histidine kinase n=1 Tax=Cyclobacterium jeungdonense TaxID=708087 RepID=A0ABT8CER4_9BACT|nr:ATP-binding protein [Cyclobacterium jeungdonense]MDN3690449.1 ATP-binding protein [Cyclobacterium jeungdonense]
MEKENAFDNGLAKRSWKKYRQHVFSTCLETGKSKDPLNYWRDYLFVTTLLFIIPLSLITLIPGIYLAYLTSLNGLIVADGIAIAGLLLITHLPGISLIVRKWIFIGITYGIGIILIYYLGNFGPGLLYLLAISIFMILVLPGKSRWVSLYLNLASCLVFGWVIQAGNPFQDQYTAAVDIKTWVAISTNLIFLNVVFIVLIPILFKGLHKSLEEQYLLQEELEQQKNALKRSLAEVESKNEELEHFTYVASHDLQEPLRMVTGFLQLLEKRYAGLLNEKGKSYIMHAVDGANRMRQLILDLLKYSRIQTIQEPAHEVDMSWLCAEVKNTLAEEIEKRNAEVSHGPLPKITGHHSLLLLVIQNLMSNALKYSKTDIPPKVHLSYQDRGTKWLFQVTDNGIGIHPDYFQKIFVLFQRLHQKDKYQGTGMGLAIVKKIIENMGGEVWLESTEGLGTSFYFTLPKIKPEE